MRAWFAGDFDRCLELCDRVRPSDVDMVSQLALLRARALIRLGRPQEALAVVSGVFIAHGTLDASLTARMLLGQAYVRLGEHERGLAILEEAYRGAADAHPTVRSEIALNVGLGYYGLRDLDRADAALALVSDGADIVHARSLEYRGWVAQARFDFAGATGFFTAALRRLDACRHYDRFLEANAIQALLLLAAERFDRTAWIFAEPRAERFDWSAGGLTLPRFGIAVAASVFYEADGRIADALLAAREAESYAPSPAYGLLARVRRSAILRAAEERFAHADLVGAIRRELDRLEFGSLHGDTRDLPFAVAEEIAYAGDVPGARALLKRCEELPQPSAMTAGTGDPREPARRAFLDAVIADAAGDQREAHRHYQRAFQLYHGVGWERLALQAALRLGELSGQTYLLEYADRTLRKLSAGSPLRARRNHPVLADPAVAGLSRTERAVLMLVCEGKTTVEIAQARTRSKQTIRNTISRILTSFGVADRPALLRECLRRGIIAHRR
ncbi:MAG TPA: LuxR C-terminal-related transcriptional regulator [Candidatus Elarobacter sp.]